MIKDIKAAFKQILPNLAWMDDATREKAIEKVTKPNTFSTLYLGIIYGWWIVLSKNDLCRLFRYSVQAEYVDNKIGYPDWIKDDGAMEAYLEGVSTRFLRSVIK